MDAEREREALRLLDGLQSVAPGERGAWLDERCGGDAALRAEVERLAATQEESFLRSPLEPGTPTGGSLLSGGLAPGARVGDQRQGEDAGDQGRPG